jgi:hypothetical protein
MNCPPALPREWSSSCTGAGWRGRQHGRFDQSPLHPITQSPHPRRGQLRLSSLPKTAQVYWNAFSLISPCTALLCVCHHGSAMTDSASTSHHRTVAVQHTRSPSAQPNLNHLGLAGSTQSAVDSGPNHSSIHYRSLCVLVTLSTAQAGLNRIPMLLHATTPPLIAPPPLAISLCLASLSPPPYSA